MAGLIRRSHGDTAEVSICIVTHNQPSLLALCVASCFEEMKRARTTGEVIVVDNASADSYPEKLAETFPDIRIIRNEQNRSFSAANNQGIQASRGKYVLFLNDDAVLRPYSLGRLLKVIEADPMIGAVGAKLVNPDGSPQVGYMQDRAPHVRGMVCWLLRLTLVLAQREWTRRLFTFTRNPEVSGETDLVVGACLLSRRDALAAAGLFDEQFHYIFEDADLCYQMRKRGWRIVYVADVEVTHYGSASFNTWPRSERFSTFISSMVYYFKKDSRLWQFLLLRGFLVLLVACRVPLLLFQNLPGGRSARKDAILMLRSHLTVLKHLLRTPTGRATAAKTIVR